MSALPVTSADGAMPWRTRVQACLPAGASTWVLSASLLLALAARTVALSTYGFSEDEVAKIRAIDAYRHGDFSANAEHPMLMKLAVWASLSAADAWNAAVPSLPIAPESALRFPNALAGTATVAALYGLSSVFFGPAVAAMTALIVALDPNVIAINRIGKEDTFLMLFFMLALYFYERAKRIGAADPARAQPSYNLAGVSFGLMFASKYMVHLFGLFALYNAAAQWRAGVNVPRKVPYNGLIVASFLVANFAILLPSTLTYVLEYLQEQHVVHHGFLYNGQLHSNSHGVTLAGVPLTYYLHLLATKAPLPVLFGAVIGLGPLVASRRERGFVWLRVLLVVLLVSYSLFAAKFQRYALPMMLGLDVLAAVGLVTAVGWLSNPSRPRGTRVVACTAALALTVGVVALGTLQRSPFYSVYQNAIGAALAPPAWAFPEEAYDYGVREAVLAIVDVAQPGAAIVSDASMAVQYYLQRSGRPDLESRALSQEGLRLRGEQWVFVQDGHLYFENASLVSQFRLSMSPWRTYRLAGTKVLEVFRVAR